jgi:hypothetical protein
VKEVFPKAVKTRPITIKPAVVSEDGKVISRAEVIEDGLDLNADQINKARFGAIQKLIEKVEALENGL